MTREEFIQKWSVKLGIDWPDELRADFDALELSLPPAEGAEQLTKEQFTAIIEDSVKDVWYGRRSMNPVKEQTELLVEKLYPLMNKPQPTAEGAGEINKMIGQTKDSISKRYNKNYWEILGDYHSNGRLTTNDFIDELLNEFATLHAHKIADKMVSERLREELIKFVTWYDTYDGEIQMIAVDNYLKSRDNGSR